MKYVDCNESSWQVELWIRGQRVRFSARSASSIVDKENDEHRKARQVNGGRHLKLVA